jgi:hypothetical protein
LQTTQKLTSNNNFRERKRVTGGTGTTGTGASGRDRGLRAAVSDGRSRQIRPEREREREVRRRQIRPERERGAAGGGLRRTEEDNSGKGPERDAGRRI